MTDHDDGDEFILDIIEDVCSSAMDSIFQNYIQNQLVPYTVVQAKDAILQIIEVCCAHQGLFYICFIPNVDESSRNIVVN